MTADNQNHRIPIYVTMEQYEWLRTKSFIEKISIAEIIRDLVEKAIDEEHP